MSIFTHLHYLQESGIHGRTTGEPWENYGGTMGEPWEKGQVRRTPTEKGGGSVLFLTDLRILGSREKKNLPGKSAYIPLPGKIIAKGMSNKKIGNSLFISTRTVDAHRYNIMQKIQARNAAELVMYAVNNKLVD